MKDLKVVIEDKSIFDEDETYLCPTCGHLVSVKDFDTGQLRADTISVFWTCSHCGTSGEDKYEKMATKWQIKDVYEKLCEEAELENV